MDGTAKCVVFSGVVVNPSLEDNLSNYFGDDKGIGDRV